MNTDEDKLEDQELAAVIEHLVRGMMAAQNEDQIWSILFELRDQAFGREIDAPMSDADGLAAIDVLIERGDLLDAIQVSLNAVMNDLAWDAEEKTARKAADDYVLSQAGALRIGEPITDPHLIRNYIAVRHMQAEIGDLYLKIHAYFGAYPVPRLSPDPGSPSAPLDFVFDVPFGGTIEERRMARDRFDTEWYLDWEYSADVIVMVRYIDAELQS